MTVAKHRQSKGGERPSECAIVAPGDLNGPEHVPKGAGPEVEPPEWFMQASSTIDDAFARLYEDTTLQLEMTQVRVHRAVAMLAKMSNVFARRAGLTMGYEIVPFTDGSWPPIELTPLVSDDAVHSLSHMEREIYLSGYGIVDWNEGNWRLQLFNAIGAPIDLPAAEEDNEVFDTGPIVDLSELSDDDDDRLRCAPGFNGSATGNGDVDDGAPFPEAPLPPPPEPSYEQTYADVAPGMRDLGAPEWFAEMAARLMYNIEYELDYETSLQLDDCIEASMSVAHAFSSMNEARGDGSKKNYVLCPFTNGKYPCTEPYNLRSIFTVRDLDYLTMRDLRWYITGYGHPVPDTRAERIRLLKIIVGINA
ncbi:hypothetical protein HDZ31DRAFT_60496 [Schizophyllum fasciatum]